jgi:hypothetical protein
MAPLGAITPKTNKQSNKQTQRNDIMKTTRYSLHISILFIYTPTCFVLLTIIMGEFSTPLRKPPTIKGN